ncbi:hypothetical protein ABT369_09405 [Dactylosporangium sp. NPDC000244]|uniref:hypothetical protein n=1 Tax=Dactylosporangium sp. NPDC000244 TaxID=3154365 RepID=UPI00332D9867
MAAAGGAEVAVVVLDATGVLGFRAAAIVSWCVVVANLALFHTCTGRIVRRLPVGDPRRPFWCTARMVGAVWGVGYAAHLPFVVRAPGQGLGEHGVALVAAVVGMVMLVVALLLFPPAGRAAPSTACSGPTWRPSWLASARSPPSRRSRPATPARTCSGSSPRRCC